MWSLLAEVSVLKLLDCGKKRSRVCGRGREGRPLTDDNLIASSREPMSRVRSSDPKWSGLFIGTFPWAARHGSIFSSFAKRGCIISEVQSVYLAE